MISLDFLTFSKSHQNIAKAGDKSNCTEKDDPTWSEYWWWNSDYDSL